MGKNIGVIIIAGVILAGVSFYGGLVYGKSTVPQNTGSRFNGQFTGQFGGSSGGGFRNGGGRGGGAGAVAGEILSKDQNTMTVKLLTGGTKLVMYSSSTAVRMTTDASADNLQVGKFVTVNGSANADGSVIASVIQVRPFAPSSSPNGLPGGGF